jgi:hypothetical protein
MVRKISHRLRWRTQHRQKSYAKHQNGRGHPRHMLERPRRHHKNRLSRLTIQMVSPEPPLTKVQSNRNPPAQ